MEHLVPPGLYDDDRRTRSDRYHAVRDGLRNLFELIGENPDREGLLETPDRVIKAWSEWCSGYRVDPSTILKSFEDGAEKVDEMVVVRGIDLWSSCEHHMAPFFGSVDIAYIPDGRIVGLSKLARLVEVYGRRLQVQERLTNQIADALWEHLKPQGVGVIVRAKHMCMCSRGVRHTQTDTVTSALRGCIKDEAEARAEFLKICGDGR